MNGGFDTLLYHKQAGIAWVVLNRPQALNVYNIRMRDELYQVLEAIRDDPDVGVVVFRGEGRAFCAGADLTEFLTAPPPTAARRARWGRDVWGLFLGLPQPLIAALHGYVLGSGMEIALCCDLRLAARGTRLGLPEVGLGIIPAAGGTQTLPRAILPQGKAMEMLLNGEFIDAEEALRLGLVGRVVPPDNLLGEAEAMAQHLLGMPPGIATRVKRAVHRGLDMSLREGLDMERGLGWL
ncbi:MAG: enoyl-CoA hydratase/isomerase family protein [Dehalococcoidia bacterium]|nr:enoyl-CoA hydratase/isomerase family protein [Dehalococcoidia bacterium]MDP6783098.1 enoyl-CoA hydratase/isomerase family protein [Dehalococcoidia bacterium]